MSRWGDDIDEELKKNEKVKAKFMISFKTMNYVVRQIEETTKEWDDKYPKFELLKIWANVLLFFVVLFTFTYNILIVVTGILFIFYGFIIFQIFGVWRSFKYSGIQYWLMTLAGIAAAFGIGWVLQSLIF